MKVAEWKFTGKGGKGKPALARSPSNPSSPSRSYMDVLKGTAETLPQADATEANPKGGSSDGTPPKTFVQPKMNKTKRSKAQKQPQFEEASVEKNSESTRKASAESSASMSASASSIALSA